MSEEIKKDNYSADISGIRRNGACKNPSMYIGDVGFEDYII
jgi:hypothetical protein